MNTLAKEAARLKAQIEQALTSSVLVVPSPGQLSPVRRHAGVRERGSRESACYRRGFVPGREPVARRYRGKLRRRQAPVGKCRRSGARRPRAPGRPSTPGRRLHLRRHRMPRCGAPPRRLRPLPPCSRHAGALPPFRSRGCRSPPQAQPSYLGAEPTPMRPRRPSGAETSPAGPRRSGASCLPPATSSSASREPAVSLGAGRQDDRRPYWRAVHVQYARADDDPRRNENNNTRRRPPRRRSRVKRSLRRRCWYDHVSDHVVVVAPRAAAANPRVDDGATIRAAAGSCKNTAAPQGEAAEARVATRTYRIARCWTSRAAVPPRRSYHAPRRSPIYRCCSPVRPASVCARGIVLIACHMFR